MARPKNDKPSYLLHRQSGRARVNIDGTSRLLPGRFNSAESRAEYDRLLGLWYSNGRTLPPEPTAAPAGPTVTMIAAAFWRFAEAHYVDANGQPTGEAIGYRYALRPLTRLFGGSQATEFGPKALKALRAAMLLPQVVVDDGGKPTLGVDGQPLTRPGWSRRYCNRQVDRIQRVFAWAASEELMPASVAQAVGTVESLRRGREGVRETEPVTAVPIEAVEAVLPHVADEVAAMINVQLLTGMRPGEVVTMRGVDIDTKRDVWIYRPQKHKTEHHGHAREIRIGPRAKAVLGPFLKPGFLFSPTAAEQERRERQHEERKTPMNCGNKPGSNRRRRSSRKTGEHYGVASYYRAIERGCDQAFPPPAELARRRVPARRWKIATRWETVDEWRKRLGAEKWEELRRWQVEHRWHPHQLRHTAGTIVRRTFDFEAAKLVLGHRTDTATAIYAERDERKAEEVVALIG